MALEPAISTLDLDTSEVTGNFVYRINFVVLPDADKLDNGRIWEVFHDSKLFFDVTDWKYALPILTQIENLFIPVGCNLVKREIFVENITSGGSDVTPTPATSYREVGEIVRINHADNSESLNPTKNYLQITLEIQIGDTTENVKKGILLSIEYFMPNRQAVIKAALLSKVARLEGVQKTF